SFNHLSPPKHKRDNMVSDEPKKESSYLTGWRLGMAISCLFFANFLIALDANIINVAIPRISSDFHALDDVAWYGTGYLLTITTFQPLYGTFYRLFRTDVVYLISIIIFELGTIICAAASSSPLFIVGRAIAGLGAAGVLQGSLSIIGQVVILEKRPLYMGLVISAFAVTVCLGPPLGGEFTEHASWRWCFWINLPIGAVVLIGLSIFLKVRGDANALRRLPLRSKLACVDFIGCTLFLGAVCCLLLALQWGGQTKPWSSVTIIGLFVGTVALITLFAYVQWQRDENALIPLRVLRKRNVLTSAMVLFFLGGAIYLFSYYLPFYFEAVRGISAVTSGVNFIPLMLSQMVSLVIIGAVVKECGHYVSDKRHQMNVSKNDGYLTRLQVPFILFGNLVAIVGAALLTQLDLHTATIKWAAYFVVTGIGLGMAMQLPYTAIHITLSAEDLPTGNAIAVLFYQLGGAISISMGQTVVLCTIEEELQDKIPGLTSKEVFSAGAANLESLVSTRVALTILREIWNDGIQRNMYLAVSLIAAAVPFTLCMQWLNSKKVARQIQAKEEMENTECETQKKSVLIEGSEVSSMKEAEDSDLHV
ncbi:MFS general substrate transporter, partial [Penicillium malachiteum]